MFEVSIPKISDEKIMERYEKIKPVITRNGKLYHLREFTLNEIKGTSYIWNAAEDVRKEIGKNELEILEGREFVCLHSYGYPGLFKPSIYEILAQIEEVDILMAQAFEIIDYPKVAEDFYKDSFTSIAFANGYHVSTVRLYRKNDDIIKKN